MVYEESDEQLVEFEFDCDDKGNKVTRYEHNILYIVHCVVLCGVLQL